MPGHCPGCRRSLPDLHRRASRFCCGTGWHGVWVSWGHAHPGFQGAWPIGLWSCAGLPGRTILAGATGTARLAGSVDPSPFIQHCPEKRGFNPAAELALQLSRQLGIPVMHGGLVCRADHPPQKTLDLRQRMARVRGRYACNRSVSSLRVGLVDDVMTTGSTLREISRVLMGHGAACVILLVGARTPMAPLDLAKSHHV